MIEWFSGTGPVVSTLRVQTFDFIHVTKLEKWKINESRFLSSLKATSNNTLFCDKRVSHEEVELYSTALDKKALGYDFTIYRC
jgi:hypothetical protein